MDLKMLNRFVQGRIKDLVFFFGGGVFGEADPFEAKTQNLHGKH